MHVSVQHADDAAAGAEGGDAAGTTGDVILESAFVDESTMATMGNSTREGHRIPVFVDAAYVGGTAAAEAAPRS